MMTRSEGAFGLRVFNLVCLLATVEESELIHDFGRLESTALGWSNRGNRMTDLAGRIIMRGIVSVWSNTLFQILVLLWIWLSIV